MSTWVVVSPVGAKAEVFGPYSRRAAERQAEHLEAAGFAAYPAEMRTAGQLNQLANEGQPA